MQQNNYWPVSRPGINDLEDEPTAMELFHRLSVFRGHASASKLACTRTTRCIAARRRDTGRASPPDLASDRLRYFQLPSQGAEIADRLGGDSGDGARVATGRLGLGHHHHTVDVGLDRGGVLHSRDDHQLETELAERLQCL